VAAPFVTSTVEDGVATITLDRAPLNILNIDMMEQVNQALLSVRDRRDLRVLLLRGKGKAFCAGVDVADHTPERVARMLQVFLRIYETMRMIDVVSVAAVQGPAIGGGFELAISCNLIVASDKALFALPEIELGVFPPVAAVILPRTTPRRKAMEWILMGEKIPAKDLAEYGIVNRIYKHDKFEAGLKKFVAALASKSAPVLRLARKAQLSAYYSTYEQAVSTVENLYLHDLMSLSDSKEGIAAFLEKRKPVWRHA
jgi:cyclohexa-1,5-dienecarbonyl-CoA hydratase